MAASSIGATTNIGQADVTTASLPRSTESADDTVVQSVGEERSLLFAGMTKAEEVVIVAAVVVVVLALLALLLRLTMSFFRRKKKEEKEKADSHGDSATWSTSGSVGHASGSDKTADTEVWSTSSKHNTPTLSRLESLNLKDVYVENWRKTSATQPPVLPSGLWEIRTEL